MKTVHVLAAVALAAVVPWIWDNRYIFHIATMTALMIPLATSMNLMLKVGQLSLAHAAFMGIGAYTGALATMRLGFPPLLSLLSGGLMAALIAGSLGPVFLRIKGVYFILLTFAFGEIVNLVLQDWTTLTGGNAGLYGIPKFSMFGLRLTATHHYYLLALAHAVICFAALWAIERSDVGAILDSLDENEMLARSLGGDALAWRIAAFVVSAFFAGTAGALYAFYVGLLTPDNFGFRMIVDLIVMNVIGGPGTVFGPLVGAIVVVPLPELLREARQYQLLIYAVCLIAILLFGRKGITALIRLEAKRP